MREVYAKQNGVKFFNIPKNVGGRFSVLSAIGLVPLMLCGYDAAALLEGARACKRRFLEDGDDTLLQKAYHYATHKNAKINVVFSCPAHSEQEKSARLRHPLRLSPRPWISPRAWTSRTTDRAISLKRRSAAWSALQKSAWA